MADVVREQGEADLVGFLDDDTTLIGKSVDGAVVLGTTRDPALLASSGASHFLAAIGNNRIRAEVFGRLVALGLEPWSAIHPATVISRNASLEAGVQIVAGVIINPGAQIGRNVILNTACSIDHDCRVGDHAFVGPGARVGGAVQIGEAALIGIGATILPCLSIGAQATVGAGAVVTRDIPEGMVVVGCPAKPIRSNR
jgi:sugar O-acyltransferase (sialic acid O-acetyltransferase NeuD family)